MRRKIAMIAVLGGLAAGFGCRHVGGKHDCGYNSSDYPIPQTTAPHVVYPVPGTPPKDDPLVIPKTKNGGSDKEVKDKDMKLPDVKGVSIYGY